MNRSQKVPQVLSNLKVDSRPQKTELPAPNSLFVEDIYRAIEYSVLNPIMDEMALLKMSPEYQNPLQREVMFRMPGKPLREPVSEFAKFKMQSLCLCKKYSYAKAKETLFTAIDAALSDLDSKFAHKMQQANLKQVDLQAFQDEVSSHTVKPKTASLIDAKKAAICAKLQQLVGEFGASCLRPENLNQISAVKSINTSIRDFEKQIEECLQFDRNAEQIEREMRWTRHKIRFAATSPEFTERFSIQASMLLQDLKDAKDILHVLQIQAYSRVNTLERSSKQ